MPLWARTSDVIVLSLRTHSPSVLSIAGSLCGPTATSATTPMTMSSLNERPNTGQITSFFPLVPPDLARARTGSPAILHEDVRSAASELAGKFLSRSLRSVSRAPVEETARMLHPKERSWLRLSSPSSNRAAAGEARSFSPRL